MMVVRYWCAARHGRGWSVVGTMGNRHFTLRDPFPMLVDQVQLALSWRDQICTFRVQEITRKFHSGHARALQGVGLWQAEWG